MITLKDSIEIKTTHEKIFDWFVHFEKNYHSWHPDHVDSRWLKGKPFEVGSILYVEEYLHGKLHKFKFCNTKIEKNRKIEFKLSFPMSIICPKGSFIIEPKGEDCIFTATLSLRLATFFLTFAKSRVEAVNKHMQEEGENLKRLLER